METADQTADATVGDPQSGPRAVPLVGQTRELGFPIRITGSDGARRLMQQRSLRFDFVAAGTSFETRGESIPGGVALSIRARLGLLPYSAQSRPAREEAVALIAAPPHGAAARVTAGSQVVLDGSLSLPELVTPVTLIAALTEWVVNVQPWLSAISRPLRQRA